MRTLAKDGQAVLIEKKSRFIGYAKAVTAEGEAQEFISTIKKRNWDATHNVYAYQIGAMDEVQKSTDDGEPSGTAGRPVLETIKNADLKNTVIVVTRYFGGVLLGTGGLVRAYTKAAQGAIEDAGIQVLKEGQRLCMIMNYTLLGKVQNDLAMKDVEIGEIDYQNNAALYCTVNKEETKEFMREIRDAYGDQVKITLISGEVWRKVRNAAM